MTTYQENTAKVENASIPQQEAAYVIDVGFGADVHEKEADKTMHGNLVYDMVDDVAPEEDYLPDPEVYEAARRIDEERWFYRFVKRAFDIVFSATVLFLFCWLYIIMAIAIKIDDPKGPVIFKQERVEQVIIRHNFGSCLLNTIKAQLESGIKLVLNKPKCAFGRKGCDSVSSAAPMVMAA